MQFTDLSTAENTTITSWEWDFDYDGTIDSNDPNPTWTYNETGTFTVSLTVSDGELSNTEKKVDYITVLPAGTTIVEIGNITGGLFKVSAEIVNKGTLNLTSLNWNITLAGGIIFVGNYHSGTIASLPAGGTTVIADTGVIGFGRIGITVTVTVPDGEPITKTANGFLLFFVVIGVK